MPDRDPRQGSLPDRDPDPPSQRHDNLVHKQLPMWGGRMGGRRGGRRGGMRRGRRGGMRRGMRTENFSSRAAYSLGVHINWWISRGAQLVQTSRLASAGSNFTPRLSWFKPHASPQLVQTSRLASAAQTELLPKRMPRLSCALRKAEAPWISHQYPTQLTSTQIPPNRLHLTFTHPPPNIHLTSTSPPATST